MQHARSHHTPSFNQEIIHFLNSLTHVFRRIPFMNIFIFFVITIVAIVTIVTFAAYMIEVFAPTTLDLMRSGPGP
jgi:hypothetical protein